MLTKDKSYKILHTRSITIQNDDICIEDDSGCKWWLGQYGSYECWDNWLISKELMRDERIDEILKVNKKL
jgi:hypothetical protein